MDVNGIFGEARRASENADQVEYAVFLDEVMVGKGEQAQSRQLLEECKMALLNLVQPIIDGYIWQKDAFDLRVVDIPGVGPGWKVEDGEQAGGGTADTAVPPHLYGSSRFGDNIDDEWFIVFLLMYISRCFPAVTITVRDSDGYFLLIEAAYALPKWLEPDTSANRVFIRRGALHLISPPAGATRRHEPPPISLADALAALRDPSVETRASDRIQSAVQRPIAGYPERARSNQHRARCLLPLRVAHILRQEPQLVAPAVEAFYDRDVDSMKAAAKMAFALPEGSQTPLVKASVQFSRAMYAQLRQQEFQAPKPYPPLPPPHHPDFLSAELGMKLAVGFEMLYADRARYGQTAAEDGEEAPQSRAPPQDDPGWRAFKQSLESRGYFRDFLEGSAEHSRLLAAAVAEYRQTQAAARVNEKQYDPAKRMEDILRMPATAADFPESALPSDDSDAWLFDGETELTQAMRERESEMEVYARERAERQPEGPAGEGSPENAPGEASFDTTRVVDTMKKFVESMSSYQGAEVPPGARRGEEGPDVNIDMDKFMTELEAALGLGSKGGETEEGEDLDSDLDSDMDWDEGGGSDAGESEEGVIARPEMAGPSSRMKEAREVGGGSEEGESDSDDSFMEEYGEVMDQQLSSSTLPQSFVRPSEAVATDSDAAKRASESEPAANSKAETAEEDTSEEPLNVDVNLMKNLLDSYSAQQGLPGPASNLLGMLGLHLPDDEKQAGGSSAFGKESSLGIDDDLEAPD
ncbi:hypothetical protein KFL_010610030 [Klebsormidium nitens]|uniref:Uncharacterized protein n=1 Tax=Klebsormidium nitens TaxID=105231 RepID=A0A1Y1IPJ8_KLENI|nr:hypothetical protein KFL_010610030 [Klebsormidium nitens]|eukprot:GAQ92583.1 hypothetical protein KFL_010610030 [Klebsormidium nitens]